MENFAPTVELVRRAIEFSCTGMAVNHITDRRNVSVTVMTITESTLYHYRKSEQAPEKWSFTQTARFLLLTCGLFWGGVFALVFCLI